MPIKQIRHRLNQAKQLLQTFVREFAFVFRFAPKHALLATGTQLGLGVLPAAELYVGAYIIDELLEIMGSGAWSHLLIWLVALELVLLGIQRFLFSCDEYLRSYLQACLHVRVNDRIHQMVTRFDLPTLEQSSVYTLVSYLKEQTWRPTQMVYSLFLTIGNMVASLSFIAITFSPFFATLFAVAVLPSIAISAHAVYTAEQISWGKAELMKQVWYFENLLKERRSLLELMIHRLGPYFSKRYKQAATDVSQKEISIENENCGEFSLPIWAPSVSTFSSMCVLYPSQLRA